MHEFIKKVAKYKLLFQIGIIALFFIGGAALRFHAFNNPVADWHSWRQADTAAVTRNFVKEGFTPLYPKFDSEHALNEQQIPDPHRYFFAEFPLYNILSYYGFTTFGHFTIEEWGRLVSIFFSSLGIVFLYLLVKQYSSEKVALVAAFVFAFLPYNVYYGRVIMPDPMHITFSILALYLITLWTGTGKWWWAILGGVAYAIAVLTKPYALVLLLPIAYLILREWKHKLFLRWDTYLFAIIGLVPYLLWKHHIDMYPEGQFATVWLYNEGNIRFTGAYFHWLIYDRMNRLIFATGGFVLFWLGIISGNNKKEGFFYYLWLVSVLIFFVVIAKGNVTHDYYQMPIVPIGAIFIGKGTEFLLEYGRRWYHRMINYGVALALLLLMLAFGWFEVRGYYNINHPEIVEAGQTADRILPKDAKVIAPYDNDSSFLYQTNRYGWPIGGDQIPQWIKEGAQYLISVNYDDTTNYWMSKCSVVTKNPKFVIVNLTQCKGPIENPPQK
ncbi:MAG: ArnT family glycosyltransferase [Candidatus Levyibacteriota bacterium]